MPDEVILIWAVIESLNRYVGNSCSIYAWFFLSILSRLSWSNNGEWQDMVH